MGCFDSVYFRCLECGGEMEVQSKAGDCLLRTYTSYSVPPEIAADIEGNSAYCEKCDAYYTVYSLLQLKGIPMGVR